MTYPNGETYTLDYQTNKTSVTKKNESGTEVYTTSAQYDGQTGKTLSETDADGEVTSYEYTYADNPYLVTKTTKKIGYEVITSGKVEMKTEEKVTESSYDEYGNVTEETVTEDGMETSKTVSEYDEEGNLLAETETSADVVSDEENTYDAMGRMLRSTNKETGEVTEYTYDYLGRATKTVTTLNGKTQTSTIKKYGDRSGKRER